MTKLYVANATRQKQDFTWRPYGSNSPRIQHIAIGGQVQVSGVESTIEAQAVIEQHERYGLISIDEVKKLRAPFYGLFYSIDRPITAAMIEEAMHKRQDTVEETGRQSQELEAIQINANLERSLEEEAEPGSGLRNLEVSVVEEEPAGGYRGDKPVALGYRINRSDDASPKPSALGRRGARKKGA